MPFKQDLQLFAECIITVGINSPDTYPSWMLEYGKSQEEIFDQDSLEIKELWEKIKIKIKIKIDIEKSELINQKLNQMFTRPLSKVVIASSSGLPVRQLS